MKINGRLCLGLTSNKGANDFEMLKVYNGADDSGRNDYLYEKVLSKVAQWGTPNNLMFVVGATQATEFQSIRNIIPEHFLLVPGVGFQGGSLQEVSTYAMNKDCGLLVNASRAIIYAGSGENFAEEAGIIAEQYQAEMRIYLEIINMKVSFLWALVLFNVNTLFCTTTCSGPATS